MNTHAIEWLNQEENDRKSLLPVLSKANRTACYVAKIISILVIAIMLVIVSYMALMSPAMLPLLQAGVALTGFIFLALAIDSEKASNTVLLAATGIALPILAGLSTMLLPGYIVVASTVIVAWITASIIRR